MTELILDLDGDRMTVADLQIFGLSIRTIEMLDREFGVIYVDQLACLTEKRLLAGVGINKVTVAEIKRILRRFRAGRPTKTVQDCVQMAPGARKRPLLTRVQRRGNKWGR